MSGAGRIVVVLAVVLMLISLVPIVSATVIIDESGEYLTYPGNPVYISFTVTNTNSMTVSVEIVVDTDWDVYISSNNFLLVYSQQSNVDIQLTPPAGTAVDRMETVIITFKEISTLASEETEFTFDIWLMSEAEYFGEPESMEEIVFGDDGIETFDVILVIILVAVIAVAVISIRKRFVVDNEL
jgi:hypothetical protein